MGKTYQFECELCQYRTKVSGGADSGVHCEVQTVVCLECRELYDVFTRLRRREDADGNKQPKFPGFFRPEIPPVILAGASAGRRLVWQEFKPACPVEPKHRVEPWRAPGRCPHCGSFIEKNGIPFRLWD